MIAALAGAVLAATPVSMPSRYNPRETFAPLTLPDPVNRYRSANGAPGPDYWQNRADYQIHARLDAAAKTLSGDVAIAYTNNSPDTLDCLWLQLDQNIYRRDARSVTASSFPRSAFTDGFVIESVSLSDGGHETPARWLVSDTRMQVRLLRPLTHGGRLSLRIKYHYAVPGLWGGRTAWAATAKGDIFDIAQWYPRMAVYDDIRGWDTSPYLGQEFHSTRRLRLFRHCARGHVGVRDRRAGKSAGRSHPASAQSARGSPPERQDGDDPHRRRDRRSRHVSRAPELTWHFHMKWTPATWRSAPRGLSSGTPPASACRVARPPWPSRSIRSRAAGRPGGRSTEYLKDSVEHFSARWGAFPWPNAINVAGGASGMEYPGVAFDGIGDKGKELF